MKCPKIFAALLAIASLTAAPMMPAHAAINSMSLGASYNAQKTSITFRVYSSQATAWCSICMRAVTACRIPRPMC